MSNQRWAAPGHIAPTFLAVFLVVSRPTPGHGRFVTLELGKGQKEQTSNKKGTAPHWFEEFNLSVWDLDESVVVQVRTSPHLKFRF